MDPITIGVIAFVVKKISDSRKAKSEQGSGSGQVIGTGGHHVPGQVLSDDEVNSTFAQFAVTSLDVVLTKTFSLAGGVATGARDVVVGAAGAVGAVGMQIAQDAYATVSDIHEGAVDAGNEARRNSETVDALGTIVDDTTQAIGNGVAATQEAAGQTAMELAMASQKAASNADHAAATTIINMLGGVGGK